MRIDPAFDILLITLIVVPITLALTWLEWRRAHKFRISRMIAVLFMMVALLGIFLKPTYKTERTSSIILLTPGYTSQQADSLLQKNQALNLMHFENVTPYKNSKQLSYYDLVDRGKEIRFILGQGLPTHTLALWNEKNYGFLPAALGEGINSLHVPSGIFVNRKTTISGTINSNGENGWLYLKSPATVEDSVRISTGKNSFQLSFTPRLTGNFLYSLSSTTSPSDKRGEFVPIHIEHESPLRILFLQHYPIMETQQLKQFLGRKKHVVMVRSQVSKNNFRNEFINMAPVQVNHLTKTVLENFDLVIADGESLQTFSLKEKEILSSSIQSGLGLLNISPNTNQKKSLLIPFSMATIKTDTAEVSLESRRLTLPATAIRVHEHPELTAIHKNKNRVLSGYTFSGVGKIGFQLLQETYRLALSGDSIAYAALWAPLLENVSRMKSVDSKIKIVSPFPYFENEPLDIEVISSVENLSLANDSIQLPLLEDANIDNLWYTKTWPTSSGWHTLTTERGTSLPYYVFKQNSWRSLSIANQTEMTKQSEDLTSSDGISLTIWKEIPPIVWYVVFLLSAGFLWLAPKL